jgi:hypothetical protein
MIFFVKLESLSLWADDFFVKLESLW